MANNTSSIYATAINNNKATHSINPTIPETYLQESTVDNLINKIKKYKLTGWNSCRLFLDVNSSMDIHTLEVRYNNALNIVTSYEQEKDTALNAAYTYLKPYIRSMIMEKYIPHIQDVITASEAGMQNNYEISSALKALATELSLKNIHVLTDNTIVIGTLEKKIIELIRDRTQSGNETQKLSIIQSMNLNNEFLNTIFSITVNQSEEEKKANIWKIMTNVLYEVKSIDEIKLEVQNNPNLGHREKPIGHEINEILEALEPIFKELIYYKMITNIPKAKELSKRISYLTSNDYLTEIDLLLMTLGFDSKKQVDEQRAILSNNTEAFIDFRYLEKLSNENVNRLLSSLSVAAYMILDYTLKNESLAHKNMDVSNYNPLQNIFSPEEYESLNELITADNLDKKQQYITMLS